MNVFALVKVGENNQTEIRRIPLSQNVTRTITEFYSSGVHSLMEGKEIIDFNGNFTPDEEQLFRINNFPLQEDIISSLNNPILHEVLNLQNFRGTIFALYTKLNLDGIDHFVFQHFDSRKIISNRGISLFLNQETYSRVDTKGITISGNLTAVLTENQLYFNSYFNTKKIFNLTDYYQEATAEDITTFLVNPIFNFQNVANFDNHLDSTVRKKIKSIQLSGVLNQINVQEIIVMANNFGIELTSDDQDKLIIPDDKNSLKNLLRFLDEDYFITPITSTKCMTNSKIALEN